MSTQTHRRLAVAGLAVAALAAGALAATPTATAVQAAPGDSPLVLKAPDSITVRSHGGQVYSDFGLSMVAQDENFEIRATRATYDDPIEAVWKREAGDVVLPEGSMTSWRGLDSFVKVVIKREGKRGRQAMQMPGCFNTYQANRTTPDSPATNEYPWACPYNPYTVGSVMGITEGYEVPVLGEYGYYETQMEPGTYTVTASIAPEWRARFGINDEDGVQSTEVVVKKSRRGEDWRPARPTAPDASPNLALEDTPAAPDSESAGAVAPDFAPDLQSLPAFDISLNGKGTSMRFGANVWNGGEGPIVIEGFEPQETATRARHDGERHLDAYQYYFDGAGEQTGYDQVGEFTFHEGNHNHWHFEDFARYRLLNDDDGLAGGQPDLVAPGVKSSKVSFCLANTDAVDYTLPNAEWRPENTDLSSDCGGEEATHLRQVLSTGSGDTYHQFRSGQAFRIGKLDDGFYWIGVEANPFGNLVETDADNNASYRQVELKTTPRGVRRVIPAQVGIIDESYWGGYYRAGR